MMTLSSKKSLSNIWKCFKIIFISFLIIPETYIFLILIPLILSLLLIFIHSSIFTKVVVQPMMGVIISLPSLGFLFLGNMVLGDWKESIFIKRVRTSGITKNIFLSVLILSLLLISIPALVINFGLCYSFETIDHNSCYNLTQWMNGNGGVASYLGYLFGYLLLCLTTISLSILFVGIFKRRDWSIVFISCIILFIMLISDIFFSPDKLATSATYKAIGYLSPCKYSIWSIFMFSSGMVADKNNLELISLKSQNPIFNELWQPILFSIIINVSLIGISFSTLKISFK